MCSLAAAPSAATAASSARSLPGERAVAGLAAAEQLGGVDAGLDPLGQVDLLGRGEQRGAPDGVQVAADRVGRGADGVQVGLGGGDVGGGSRWWCQWWWWAWRVHPLRGQISW